MTARIYFANAIGSNVASFVEADARLRLLDWEIREQAEEGSAAMSTLVFDDPGMDWDIPGWYLWYMVEDASTGSNSIICGGWTADQEIGRKGGDRENPLARLWSVNLTDANAYWQMRVMVGSDCKRPAETDVERVQWLLGTNELAWAYDTTTYVQTTTPVAMDAVDYRGQYVNQVMDDCAQASGRNWYTWIDLVGGIRKVMIWYGHDDWAVRDSSLSLSNDPADWVEADLTAETSLVWPISPDTKLHRDPSRQYDGVYLTYDKGAVYRDTDPRTVRRDFISPSYNVKSSAKAIARALRYLGELDEQDLVITTTVELPASKVTQMRAGMRVQFRATHLPGFNASYFWCRILSASVAPAAAGDRYRVTAELVPVEPVSQPDTFAALMRSEGYSGDLGWMHCSNDVPVGWWPYSNIQGPLEIVESSAPYLGIRALADLTVRIDAAVHFGGVVGDASITVTLRVDGVAIGSDTQTTSGGLHYWGPVWYIDVRDYELASGSVVTIDSDHDGAGWASFGTNATFVRVGRGSIYLGDGSTFTGP